MSYNGWANWQTWNVALWIGNDEALYNMAKETGDYDSFVEAISEFTGAIAFQTPDKVAWNDSGLNKMELNKMIKEL